MGWAKEGGESDKIFNPDEQNSTPIEQMKQVLDLKELGQWYEIKNQKDANRAGLLTQTAIHLYFNEEFIVKKSHPRRWFVLVGDTDSGQIGDVCLAVTPPDAQLVRITSIDPVHTTGFRNRNPYPEHAASIQALADAVGLRIPPNYRGGPVVTDRERDLPTP